jgi:uncharacterized protein (DUF2236 family)
MRALLMELAHPLIAAGVANHSQFQRQPFLRLYRTMRMMTRLTFGTRRTATKALRHIQHCHRPVYGRLAASIGCHQAGSPYDGHDPDLKLWVLATLLDSSLLLHDVFIRPLTLNEKEAYYRDGRRMGKLLGIPPEKMPSDFGSFDRYVDRMISSNVLAVGNDARQIAEALFRGPIVGRLVSLSSFVSIGLLPERLRKGYELPWDAKKQARFLRLAALSRRLRSHLPDFLCVNLQAWFVERLLREAVYKPQNVELRDPFQEQTLQRRLGS